MDNKILYLECYSGISGDMTVASLLDLGADERVLIRALESMNVDGFKVRIERTKKCGIDACSFDVLLEDEHFHAEQHCHDNHEHEHTNEHRHNHDHCHDGVDFNGDNVIDNHHIHRNIDDIYKIIDESNISDRAKYTAKNIFNVVARAESKAHGVEIKDVHFHEVGAIDSIVDIVATAVCLDNLNIDDVIVSELYEGSGHVRCQHGIIPVPVPAVVNIVTEHALKMKITDQRGEMVTPTGAAIAAAIRTNDSLPNSYKIKKSGMGAGKKDFDRANILRAYIIEDNIVSKSQDNFSPNDDIWVMETNIDDSTGENLGYMMDALFENGARDVFFTPIYMKKNRPAYMLTVLCHEDIIELMENLIFKNTTTIGIRRYKSQRTVLEREIVNVDTAYGNVRMKLCRYGENKYFYPEYEDIKKICLMTGISYKEAYAEIMKSIK